jgi:hypothetical protein
MHVNGVLVLHVVSRSDALIALVVPHGLAGAELIPVERIDVDEAEA